MLRIDATRHAPSTLRPAAALTAGGGVLLVCLCLSFPALKARADAPPAAAAGDALDADGRGDAASPRVDPKTTDPLPLRRVPQVTVTAARGERDVLEVPGHVTVLDREDIAESGAQDLPDLLRREAGIYVVNRSTNPEGYSVAPRGFLNGGGFGGTNLLVLVDGRRVNEPSSSEADWALRTLENVERIEIVRGPASAVYGDNAVGGVVHIITRQPEGPLSAELKGKTGTFDTDGGSLSVTGEEGAVGFSLFARGFSTDAFREEAEFRDRKFEGKLRFNLGERASATLTAGYSSDNRGRPGGLTRAEIDQLGRDAAEPRFFDAFSDTRVRFAQTKFEWVPWEDTRAELLAFHRKRTSSSQFDFGGQLDTETDASGLNARFETEFDLLGFSSRSTWGVDLLREDLDRNGFSGPSRSRREVGGGYLQQEIDLTEKLLLSAGVRWDDADYDLAQGIPEVEVENRFEAWSPKASLLYRLSEPVSLYASYSNGLRLPNLSEVAGVLFGNRELEPQRSDSYEVGLKVRSDRLKADVAFYHMNVSDEIFFDANISMFGRNVNLDRAQHRGVETSLRLLPTEWLELYSSYTFDDTTVEDAPRSGLEGEPVPLTPEHRGTAGVVLHLPYAFELTANGNFVGSRSRGNDVGNDFDELSKYARYDLQLAYRPELREDLTLELAAGVRNVFDRAYSEVATKSSSSTVVEFSPAPGRHYEVGATLRWR